MSFSRAFLCFVFILPILISCGDTNGQNSSSVPATVPSVNPDVPPPDSIEQPEITFKTFAAKDSAGKQLGWGYDVYVNGKRTIHQPIIPAVAGNDAFATEADATRIGELAVYKMKTTGSFPTITLHELDSLGIKHN